MPITNLQDLFDPEVLAAMISAKLDKKIRAIPYAKVDNTLSGRPGSTIKVPQMLFDEIATEVAEGAEIPIRRLGVSTSEYTIKKVGLGGKVTDEAILSGLGDPIGATGNGIATGIKAKTDMDAFEEMLGATMIYDATAESVTADKSLCYNSIVRGSDRFVEEETSDKVMFVHPKQMTTLRLDANFIDKNKYGNNVMMDGEIGMVSNIRIIPSKRVACIGGCYYNPILKLTADAESESEVPALTYYLKRDINVETERKARTRETEITADEMYVVALTNDSRIVLVKTAGADLYAEKMLDATYLYPGTALTFDARGVTPSALKTGALAYTLNLKGVAPKLPDGAIAALGYNASTTNAAVVLVGIPDAPLSGFAPTSVKYNGAAVTADDIAYIGGVPYLIVVRGLWASGGSITGASASFTVGYGSGDAVTFTWAYSGLTLSTADLRLTD